MDAGGECIEGVETAIVPDKLWPRDELNYVLQMWALNTDQGSDISATRRDMISECDKHDQQLPFDSDCIAHQYHIQVKNFCVAMGEVMEALGLSKFPFYATVAKIMHTLRNHASTFYKVVD